MNYLQQLWLIVFLIDIWDFTQCESKWLNPNLPNDEVCLTKECIIFAAMYAENLDVTVNPCENFYQFACGGYAEKTLPTMGEIHVDTIYDRIMLTKIKKMLQKPILQLHSRYHKMKEFYDSCVSTAYTEDLGVKPLLQLLDNYGGWPLLKGTIWDESQFDLIESLLKIFGDGMTLNEHIFSVMDFLDVGFSFNDGQIGSENHILPLMLFSDTRLESTTLNINSSNVKNMTTYKLSVELAVLFGASRETAEVELEEAFTFNELVNEMYKAKRSENASKESPSNSYEFSRQPLNVSTIRDLYNVTDKINWLQLLQIALSNSLTLNSEIIIMGRKDLFPHVLDLILESPKRVISNLIMLSLAAQYIEMLNLKKWKIIKKRFKLSTMEEKTNWESCLSEIHADFRPVLVAMYAHKHYKTIRTKHLNQMFSLIRAEFGNILKNVYWLKAETYQNAQNRLDELRAFIAYPVELLNDEKLQEYYQELSIISGEYLKNVINIKKFKNRKRSLLFDKPFGDNHWDNLGSLLKTDAYYLRFVNRILIPLPQTAGIYYSDNRPQALNFGSLGAVMGHEILHAFNEIGVRVSDYGLLSKWWTEEDTKVYRERAKCVIEQYNNFRYPKVGRLNGTLTLDDNVADNTGTEIAYRAYQTWVQENGLEAKLPGLSFNSNQLFWIAYANTWCTNYGFYNDISSPTYLDHSWPQFRVLGTITNSKEFGNDFNCPAGSAMNPEQKCSVW